MRRASAFEQLLLLLSLAPQSVSAACRPRMRRRASALLLLLLLLLLAPPPVSACMLGGLDVGVCAAAADVQSAAPYCASVLPYSACVPRGGAAPWSNLSASNKDDWLSAAVGSFIAQRVAIEGGHLSPNDPSLASFVPAGATVVRRFTAGGSAGADCANAYRNYACWLAFPRCDGSRRSLPLCRSVCENFFRACSYPRAMWRCYEPANFGGEAPEGTSGDQLYDAHGGAVFKRAPIAGLPFASNVDDGGAPIAVCTPSLHNRAERLGVALAGGALAALAAAALVFTH